MQKTPEISTIVASSVGLVVADIHGSIYLLTRDFEIAKSWIAHTGGRVTHMAEKRGILVTLGVRLCPFLSMGLGIEVAVARVGRRHRTASFHKSLGPPNIRQEDRSPPAPPLGEGTERQPSASGESHTCYPIPTPHAYVIRKVSTIALSATLSYLAIGLGDGTVILYRHLDQSIYSTSGSLTTLPKPRVIHESATEPITGLGFREPTEETPNVYLFIVTTNRVLCYQASGKGSGGTPAVVDEIGAGLGCAIMDWKAQEIVVARDEAIYLAGIESRGGCYAYEGPPHFSCSVAVITDKLWLWSQV